MITNPAEGTKMINFRSTFLPKKRPAVEHLFQNFKLLVFANHEIQNANFRKIKQFLIIRNFRPASFGMPDKTLMTTLLNIH